MLHNNELPHGDTGNRHENRNDRTPGAGNRINDVRTTDTESFYNGLDGGGSGGGQYETFAETHGQRGTQRQSGEQHSHANTSEQPGSHRGRGPKGYRRSDERITDDIHVALAQDDSLDASDIEVTVADGEVTLSGSVESREAKRHAANLVDEVRGVIHVGNNIRVAKQS